MSKHILRKRTSGFTVVSNNTIQVLKSNISALGLYLYLLSLPDNWEFYKTNLCKECKIGIKKLDKLLNTLCAFELVQFGQKRNKQGRFEQFYMDIYDLESIKINKIECSIAPEGQNCRTVETVRRFGEAIKEIKTNKQTNIKEIYCASGDARNRFEDFWKAYPKKENKMRAEQIWVKNKLDEKAELIINDVVNRVKEHTQWKQKQFIPQPSTYLNGKRWTDEIITYTKAVNAANTRITANNTNQTNSTVPDYGPGHPRWEELHGKNSMKGNHHESHGSEARRNNVGGNGVREIKSYLLS